MKKLILIVLLFISVHANAGQDLKLTLGIGTPLVIDGVLGTDIRDSNGNLWNSHDHVIGSFIITLPTNLVDYSFWHHSIITDNKDAGVTGLSITKTWAFTIW